MSADSRDTLIELDLGERTVLLQAWNTSNRDTWIRTISEWAANRRRLVDNNVGFASKPGLLCKFCDPFVVLFCPWNHGCVLVCLQYPWQRSKMKSNISRITLAV